MYQFDLYPNGRVLAHVALLPSRPRACVCVDDSICPFDEYVLCECLLVAFFGLVVVWSRELGDTTIDGGTKKVDGNEIGSKLEKNE